MQHETTKEGTVTKAKSSVPFTVYDRIELIPIDNKCLLFYRKNTSFYGAIEKYKSSSVYYYTCNEPERFKNYYMKASIEKIEDENGNTLSMERVVLQ